MEQFARFRAGSRDMPDLSPGKSASTHSAPYRPARGAVNITATVARECAELQAE
jgi:hypothetical protein